MIHQVGRTTNCDIIIYCNQLVPKSPEASDEGTHTGNDSAYQIVKIFPVPSSVDDIHDCIVNYKFAGFFRDS